MLRLLPQVAFPKRIWFPSRRYISHHRPTNAPSFIPEEADAVIVKALKSRPEARNMYEVVKKIAVQHIVHHIEQIEQKDILVREKDVVLREKDVVLREKDVVIHKTEELVSKAEELYKKTEEQLMEVKTDLLFAKNALNVRGVFERYEDENLGCYTGGRSSRWDTYLTSTNSTHGATLRSILNVDAKRAHKIVLDLYSVLSSSIHNTLSLDPRNVVWDVSKFDVNFNKIILHMLRTTKIKFKAENAVGQAGLLGLRPDEMQP
ncbi:hypothetical protein M427DRAFT_63575 [Gonapodya prolifera JEL478]|uniref:Uncharacterized protein n=1 Tax=Gonapodya prolifera (strain JEL478) TaxID=1344416 RepID=A0A138ZZI9_GONPJ|nr:hypothetical protein M427DRAFT_63575 [Gonapodya prolifera JEL478]|eukprot:KXS09685.1 hypothetical protein M427DRAFT_63575 [Gonapodya prolifera JEL478]